MIISALGWLNDGRWCHVTYFRLVCGDSMGYVYIMTARLINQLCQRIIKRENGRVVDFSVFPLFLETRYRLCQAPNKMNHKISNFENPY